MHDYVIVGAGSAGCVLANRLSEDPSVSVLLLEAGKRDRSINIKIPAAFPNQFHTKLDWDYATEPEPHVDNRSLYIPRGKSLGGSSSMNAMLYVRGRPLDYDAWEAQGAPGWGYRDVLPYFLKSEDNVRGASEFHGAGGPLHVSEQRSPRAMDRRLLDACRAAGIPPIRDYNGPEQDGASICSGHPVRNGRRWSTADAYPAAGAGAPEPRGAHRTPHVARHRAGSTSRAVGVRLLQGRRSGVRRCVHAGREVLLSRRGDRLAAAAACSPGSVPADGPARRLGIPVRRRPARASGENLQDHPVVSMRLAGLRAGGVAATAPTGPVPRSPSGCCAAPGKLTSTIAEAFAFVAHARPGLPAPDHAVPLRRRRTSKHNGAGGPTTATAFVLGPDPDRLAAGRAATCGCAPPIRLDKPRITRQRARRPRGRGNR